LIQIRSSLLIYTLGDFLNSKGGWNIQKCLLFHVLFQYRYRRQVSRQKVLLANSAKEKVDGVKNFKCCRECSGSP
jgi:hypothetical protein